MYDTMYCKNFNLFLYNDLSYGNQKKSITATMNLLLFCSLLFSLYFCMDTISRPPSQGGLTPIIIHMELTHLGSEASIFIL